MEQLKVTKQTGKVIVIVLLLLLSAHIIFAASTKPASVLLQEGLYAEEVEGNLDAAIKIYQEVITASQQMEQSAAHAKYRIGLCYLKKGDTEQAAKQFSQLISKYPKQESIVQEAQKQLEKLQPPITYSFGPVVERIINDDSEKNNFLLDLDTGFLLTAKNPVDDDEDDKFKWIKDNHVDIMGETAVDRNGLYGFDMAAIPLNNKFWEGLTPQNLIDELSVTKPGTPAILTAEGDLPKTYMFKTREGGMGVLQILEMQSNISPRHFKIRYKMLLQEKELSSPVPLVISTKPENFSNNVSADTKEISVTFNKEMMDKSWSWVKWNYTFPEITGQISYDKTKTICTLPVKLEPGKAYLLRINAGQYSSFMTADGVKAQPFVFVFSTLDSSGKPITIPDEMIAFAKEINSAPPDKTYTQEFSAEITPDNILKFKGTIIQKNSGDSDMTTHSFVNSDNVNITEMQDEKGQPLKFITTHNGNMFRYYVTLNEPVMAGDTFTYSTEGTMAGMIKSVIGNKDTYMFRMSHSPAIDRLTMRIETYLLPKGAELISMNPEDMKRTEKDGQIELRHEELIPIGGNIVTQFQYKLEK